MRVAYAFNVRQEVEEAEAEFDTPETIDYVAGLLEELGHEVERLDAGLPIVAFVERLASSRPELVFNTAEGREGCFREAIFPSLYTPLVLHRDGTLLAVTVLVVRNVLLVALLVRSCVMAVRLTARHPAAAPAEVLEVTARP